MLIPSSSTLRSEDFPEQQSWIASLLGPLNNFMTAVITALNGNITFGDNIPCQLITLQFVYSAPSDFPKNMRWQTEGVKPTEVRLCQATEDGIPVCLVFAWGFANQNISFSSFYKVSNSGVVPLTKGASYNIVLRGQP